MGILYGQIEIVNLLIEKGADVNTRDNDGITALIWASRKGYIKITKLLIEAGADVNAQTPHVKRYTALSLASRNGHIEIVKLLIEAGARVNAWDIHRWTALTWALLFE